MAISANIKELLQEMSEHVQDMANILDDSGENVPLAFFDACEDLQLQVDHLMRAALIAVQHKPGRT